MNYQYKTSGTCSYRISFDLEDGVVTNVSFDGGCNGNLKGISKLAENQKAHDLIASLKGIRCGLKATSCPDQFAKALETALNESSN